MIVGVVFVVGLRGRVGAPCQQIADLAGDGMIVADELTAVQGQEKFVRRVSAEKGLGRYSVVLVHSRLQVLASFDASYLGTYPTGD